MLPRELRGMDCNYREPFLAEPFLPGPQLRDLSLAVNSAERPEIDQQDLTAQGLQGLRVAVYPSITTDLRSALAAYRLAR